MIKTKGPLICNEKSFFLDLAVNHVPRPPHPRKTDAKPMAPDDRRAAIYTVQDGFHQMKPQIAQEKDCHQHQQKRSDCSHALHRCKPIYKEVGKGRQFLLLRHIDIQLFVL